MSGVSELCLLLFFAVLLIFLVLLLLVTTRMEIRIIIRNGKNFSYVIIHLLRFIRIRMNLSVRRGKKILSALSRRIRESDERSVSADSALENIAKTIGFRKKYLQPWNYLKPRITMKCFSVRTRIGTGDAATTAWASGGFFAVFSLLVLYLQKEYRLQERKLQVDPYFQGPYFDLDLDCIIHFKIGHIMITGFKMLKVKKAV